MPQTYRVGVIGSTTRGDYGHGLDTAWFDNPRTQVVAVADDNAQGLARATERLKVDQAYEDYREMLAQVALDIVAVCPRWIDQHYDMALAATQRGLHVFIEKPLCRTLAEADQLVDSCERTHARLAMALPTHYSPKTQTVKELIAGGKIGRVLEYRGRGKEDHRGGAEDLWVLGTHMLDLLLTFGGFPDWCFAQVTQNGRPITRRDVFEGNEGIGPLAGNGIRAMYGLAGGSTTYFHSYQNAHTGRPRRYGVRIYGTDGILEIVEGTLPPVKCLPDASWSPGRSGKGWQDVSTAGVGQPEPLSGKKYEARHTLAIEDLVQALDENREPRCNVYRARQVTEMIAAIFESHRQGRPVAMPLENRQNPLTMLSP